MRRQIMIPWLACLILALSVAGPAPSAMALETTVEPARLDVDTFFTGGRVIIGGRAPAKADVLVEITGPVVNAQYDLKGRVGPFWMTRDKVHLENIPGLYALLAPGEAEWKDRLPGLGLGFEHLKAQVELSESGLPKEEVLAMFMSLKKSEGLYREDFGSVAYADEKDGSKAFRAAYDFPSSTVPGKYSIKTSVLVNGVEESQNVKEFEVQETGFVKLIDDLASNQRLVYGVLAVIIALFSGGLMGVLFKGGGGH